jgi:hypothetical protein
LPPTGAAPTLPPELEPAVEAVMALVELIVPASFATLQ